ncbi:hypothetical protein KR044_013156 [Drosophila immigrans]|nr:hypothetical protein KR044_013156 [Drosophila immigrans]
MFHSKALFLTLCLAVLGNVDAKDSEDENGPQRLLELEAIFVEQLEAYISKVDKLHANINRFLAYVDVVHDDLDDPEEYFGNPVNAFTTISRLVNNWKREVIDVIMAESAVDEHHEQINQEVTQVELEHPTENDLLDVTKDILEFQYQNSLSIPEWANDVLYTDKERNQNVTLSAGDCYSLGRSCQKLEFHNSATEWLLEARSRLSHEPVTFASIKDLQVLEQLAPALQQAGNLKLANKLNEEILKAEPKHEEALKTKTTLENNLILGRLSVSNLKA